MTTLPQDVRKLTSKESPTLDQFAWQDPFLLTDQLSEDETLIAEATAAFAAEHLAPRVIDAFANEEVDPSIFRMMGQQGLLGVTLPETYADWVPVMCLTAWLRARLSASILATDP